MIENFQWLPLLIGYLLGSIPFGVIVIRLLGKGDLTKVGSGNIGATNAVRAGGKWVGLLVLFFDVGKGVLAVILARHYFPQGAEIFGAIGALLGHLYPVWLRFRGGKGVATMFGILVALDWRIGVIALLVWLAAFLITKMSSAGGLLAAASTPISALVLGRDDYFPLLLGFTLLIWWKHRANIGRILSGTEPRFGRRRDVARADDDIEPQPD